MPVREQDLLWQLWRDRAAVKPLYEALKLTLKPEPRTDDDLIDAGAGQHREAALVEVHERQMRAAALCDVLVAVQARQQEVALRLRQLQGTGRQMRSVASPWIRVAAAR